MPDRPAITDTAVAAFRRGCAPTGGPVHVSDDAIRAGLAAAVPDLTAQALVPNHEDVVHARDGVYWQRNRCGEVGGKATNDAEATCPRCRAFLDVFVGAADSGSAAPTRTTDAAEWADPELASTTETYVLGRQDY